MERTISQSRFNMWRALVSLIHADNVIRPEEKEFIRRFYNTVPFTNEQKCQLEKELVEKVALAEIFPAITDQRDRAELIYFARMLFWSDGDYHKQEARILEELKGAVVEKRDLEGLMAKTDPLVNEPLQASTETSTCNSSTGMVDEKVTARNTVGLKAIIFNMYHRLNPELDNSDPGMRLLCKSEV